MGWVAFEGPLAMHDWALFTAKCDKNRKCLRRLARLLRELRPEVLVLEAFDETKARRGRRVRKLCEAMVRLAAENGAHVEIYAREEVSACLTAMGAATRDEIAAAVIRHVQGFEHRMPPKRRPWMSEDPRMALFTAAALGLTHYRQEAELVFRSVKPGR